MKKHSLFFIFLLLIISACAHSKVIPFTSENGKTVSYPPTRTEDVGIYRSAHPFSAFTELGLITLRAYQLDLAQIYDQIRSDAAKYGADDVVNVKISNETHVELRTRNNCVPRTECAPDGSCTSQEVCGVEQVPEDVTTY